MDELHVGDKVIFRGTILRHDNTPCKQFKVSGGHYFDADELELVTPKPTIPEGWRSAINDPPDTSCDVKVLSQGRGVANGHYYRTGNTWYENGHHVVDILAWKELEPAAPARRFKRGDKVKNETCHYTATFVKYTDDEKICNCAVKRDDMLSDNDSTDLWYAEESNLELIPPAPAKPEYHKNQRVWLHVCGEVFPATFRKYTNNAITSSGGRCCVVERDDKLDGGSKHHHWLMGEEYLELIPPAPAKPEYHKNDRVWLHHNGEVHPATFKRSWWTQCRVKRDDRVVNNIATGHTGSKPGWYTTLDFIEPMSAAEDPKRKE